MTRETQSKLLGEFYAEKKNILKLKGEDYANEDVLSNFKTAGANIGISAEQQCLSLIATKVARLGNLLSGKTPNNESVSDSILDLSNYTDLLYCLVNEQITDIVNPFRGISRKSIVKLSKKEHAKSNPLTLEECIEPKPQTKRWENVKPKAIINQINWTYINEPIKEEDIFYKGGEPITEPYEPKVGDRFENLNHREYEIIQIINNKCVLKNKYGCRTYTMVELKDYIKGCHLKKIN